VDPAADLLIDAAAAEQFLELVFLPVADRGCIEFRVLKAACDRQGRIRRGRDLGLSPGFEGVTFAGWFSSPQTLLDQARKLVGVSGYVSVNPVKRDLLARSCDALVRCRNTTCDDDIEMISWLYLDIDPVRPADCSATEAECALAAARRDAILAEHPLIAAWSAWGGSGNGAWILVRLPDYRNDAEHREMVRLALREFDRAYSDQAVRVDAQTANPARLIGLPGCWKAKGSNRPDRPWRRGTMLGVGRKLAQALEERAARGAVFDRGGGLG
jgi:hypothetical protein